MKNSEQPAQPATLTGTRGKFRTSQTESFGGLTKREYFCLHMGVPETGDPELDEIINKGNKLKTAAIITSGLFASSRDYKFTGMSKDNSTTAQGLFAAEGLMEKVNR